MYVSFVSSKAASAFPILLTPTPEKDGLLPYSISSQGHTSTSDVLLPYLIKIERAGLTADKSLKIPVATPKESIV